VAVDHLLHLSISLVVAQEPIITSHPSTGAPLKTYYILHSEAILVNLLETVLYHGYAAEALGDTFLLDLVDYCMRQVNRLIITTHARNSLKQDPEAKRKLEGNADPAAEAFRKAAASRSKEAAGSADDEEEDGAAGKSVDSTTAAAEAAKRIDQLSKEDPSVLAAKQLASQCRDFSFQIGCACVTILRFLSDHLPKLPLAVIGRVLDFHDLALVMVPLLENPPWTRRIKRTVAAPAPSADGKASAATPKTTTVWQKFVDRKWQDVPSSDLLKLTPMEGQPWLTLYNLLQEPEVRKRYEMHSHRKGTLTRVRRYLNDTLVDQVPLLSELQRTLDEMAVVNAPDVAQAQSVRTALLLEPVIELQQNVEREAFGHALVQEALKNIVGDNSTGASSPKKETSSSSEVDNKKAAAVEPPALPAARPTASNSSNALVDSSLLSFDSGRPAAPSALFITPQAAQPPQPPVFVSEVSASASSSGAGSSSSSSSSPSIPVEKSWEAVAAVVARHLFPPSTSSGSLKSKKAAASQATTKGLSPAVDVRALAALYTEDEALFESLVAAASLNEPGASSASSSTATSAPVESLLPKCNVCGEPAEKRCGRCANVWYCSREHQLYDWKEGGHKPLCDIVVAGQKAKEQEADGNATQQKSGIQEA
jgi:MYND finger